jgi:hypothetical protein
MAFIGAGGIAGRDAAAGADPVLGSGGSAGLESSPGLAFGGRACVWRAAAAAPARNTAAR